MKKTFFLSLVILNCFTVLCLGRPVDSIRAGKASKSFLRFEKDLQKKKSQKRHIRGQRISGFRIGKRLAVIEKNGDALAYVFRMHPKGFVVISSDDSINPVIAYSFKSNFDKNIHPNNALMNLITQDIHARRRALEKNSTRVKGIINKNRNHWEILTSATQDSANLTGLSTQAQWPDSDYDGWLDTTWSQDDPYNISCPFDPFDSPVIQNGLIVDGTTSLTGCVATAMSQIVNYWQFPSSIIFSDSDNYVSAIDVDGDGPEAERRLWIDVIPDGQNDGNEVVEYEYNPSLNPINYNENGTNPSGEAIADLIYGCGVLVKMDYSSSTASTSTSSVADALTGRLGYTSAIIMDPNINSDFYDVLISNMSNGRPAQLSIKKTDTTGGHSIVCDGYRDDGYYHLNFGWGPSSPNQISDAWYSLPSGMPSGYDVIKYGILNVCPTDGYSGGAGTKECPYQIAIPEDLITLGNEPQDWGKHFVLINNIDLSGYAENSVPAINFTGVFDGQNNSIYGLSKSTQGLFNFCSNAIVSNLHLLNLSISGNPAADNVGGLVGNAWDSVFINCSVTGTVEGKQFVGGVFGNSSSVFASCYADVNVTSIVSGDCYTGGFGGYSAFFSSVENSYALGNVTGDERVGGFVGVNMSSISNCYSVGVVTEDPWSNNDGGFVSGNMGTITACFWDKETSGANTSGGGSGLSTSLMQDANTFISAGWDFLGEPNNGTDDLWQMPAGGGYPELTANASLLRAVPDLAGLTLSQAQTAIIEAGFATGNIDYISSMEPFDTVISSIPVANSVLMQGSEINLTVSSGPYASGDGSTENPFIIQNAQHLINVSQIPDDWDKCFLLTNDIVLSGEDSSQLQTLGTSEIPFSGIFNGGACYIANFNKDCGLFGIVDGGAIKHLTLDNVNVNGGSEIGTLINRLESGIVQNCFVTGSLTGADSCGGMVGVNVNGVIRDCHIVVDVNCSSGSKIGGFIGENEGKIIDCDSNGDVNATAEAGGFAGVNYGTIWLCSHGSDGTVSTSLQFAGGFVGANYGWITCCYKTGNVGDSYGIGSYFGGFAGKNQGIIKNCYSRSDVKAQNFSAGFAAQNSGQISESYCYRLNYQQGTPFAYSNLADLFDCFANEIILGMSDYPGSLVFLTDSEFALQSIFENAGWEFATVWRYEPNIDYPKLRNIHYKFADGDGTQLFPFMIETADQLNAIGADMIYWDMYFGLANDVNCSTLTSFNPIGFYNNIDDKLGFSGVFDGRSFKLTGLNWQYDLSSQVEYAGIFSYVENGIIQNLGIASDCSVALTGVPPLYAGILVGGNDGGTIKNCHNESNFELLVGSECYIGGIIGKNIAGLVKSCWNSGNITSSTWAGGIVGSIFNNGKIENCYNIGSINGSSCGGLAGVNNNGEICQSYNSGLVVGDVEVGGVAAVVENGTVSNCFNVGNIEGYAEAGGLCGRLGLFSQISSSYSSSNVIANEVFGAFVGFCEGDIVKSFWNSDLYTADSNGCGYIDQSTTVELTAITDLQMQQPSTFVDATWDWVNESVNGQMDFWWIYQDNYPYLYWQTIKGDTNYDGQVTIEDMPILTDSWLSSNQQDCRLIGDFNEDGVINLIDFAWLAKNWLSSK